MSISRAEIDLAEARIVARHLADQAQAAAARVVKLESYLEMARVYGAGVVEETATVEHNRGVNGSQTLAEAAVQLIRKTGKRQTTRELIESLESCGHSIGGKNKVGNLSSTLSRCDLLASNKVEGWGLTEWVTKCPKIPEAEIPF